MSKPVHQQHQHKVTLPSQSLTALGSGFVYRNSVSTDIRDTWIKHGWKPSKETEKHAK